MDSTTIGFILSVNSIVIVISLPLLGLITDHIKSVKKVFVICSIISAIMVELLLFVNNTTRLTMMIPIIALFQCSLIPLLDNWIIQEVKNNANKSYGKLRLWGSIGFASTVLLMGMVANLTTFNIPFATYGLLVLLMILVCINLKDAKYDNLPDNSILNQYKPIRSKELINLFKSYPFVSYLIFTCIFSVAATPMFNFLPSLMKNAGGNSDTYGVAMSVCALSEVPIFFLSSFLLKRFKPLTLIIFSFLFYIIRMILYSSVLSPNLIILIGTMQGLSYGLFLIGHLHYIDNLAPHHLKTSAQVLGYTMYAGLSGIIGNYIGGILIAKDGITKAYILGAYLMIITFLLFILSIFLGRILKISFQSID
jgi:PPP family 3-phenylpropionic acid transporter